MKIMLANFAKMVNDSGGLAKVTIDFANEMIRRGHEVSLLYCDGRQGGFFYDLDEQVHVHDLCHQDGGYIRMPLWMKVKREVLRPFSKNRSRDVNDQFMQKYLLHEVRRLLMAEAPEVIVSSQPAASRILLCDIATDIPVISMSHGDPEDYFHIYPKREIPAVEKSAVCQVLLPSFVTHIKNRFPETKVVVIGNVVPQYAKSVDLRIEKDTYKIIFIGRLVKNHKRPHLLIRAFAKLSKNFPDWEVEIWGAESNKAYTKALHTEIQRYGLKRCVHIMGVTRDVASVLRQGDIFVLPSAYEGFGLSLAEAMSMGLPAIGYKNCSAVNELIENEKNGLLCEDGVDALAEALRRLMTDKALRVKYGAYAQKSMEKYSPAKIWRSWEELLEQTVHRA